MKALIITAVILLVAALGWYVLGDRNDVATPTPTPSASESQSATPSASVSASPTPSTSGTRTPTPSATRTPTPTSHPDIRVTSPTRNALVSSPLTVTGEARGTWYFEASFPVKIVDANGRLVVQHYAEAQGDWMTTNFVPFRATLTFTKPATATGFLILENDNPSGLPQNAKAIAIPIRFQ